MVIFNSYVKLPEGNLNIFKIGLWLIEQYQEKIMAFEHTKRFCEKQSHQKWWFILGHSMTFDGLICIYNYIYRHIWSCTPNMITIMYIYILHIYIQIRSTTTHFSNRYLALRGTKPATFHGGARWKHEGVTRKTGKEPAMNWTRQWS